jgi:hypothetical protein
MQRFLAKTRRERSEDEVRWVRDELIGSGCVDAVRARARSLAEEAHVEALRAFQDAPDSDDKRFLVDLPFFMVERDS